MIVTPRTSWLLEERYAPALRYMQDQPLCHVADIAFAAPYAKRVAEWIGQLKLMTSTARSRSATFASTPGIATIHAYRRRRASGAVASARPPTSPSAGAWSSGRANSASSSSESRCFPSQKWGSNGGVQGFVRTCDGVTSGAFGSQGNIECDRR
jgi:hypothetical protein